MSYQRHPLFERLWPSRSDPSSARARRESFLFVVIAIVIAIAAGPEVIAAIELTTLLEILGSTLFLTAYAAGVKLLVLRVSHFVWNLLAPIAQVSVLYSDASRLHKAGAVVYVAAHAAWLLTFAAIVGAWAQMITRLSV